MGINKQSMFSLYPLMFIILVQLLCANALALPYPNPRESATSYWRECGVKGLRDRLDAVGNGGWKAGESPRNVILYLGDGLGGSVVTGARIFRSQSLSLPSDQTPFAFETLPWTGLSKTYNADRHVTDSASSATGYLSGVKAQLGTVGVGPEVPKGDCQLGQRHPVDSIAAWAIREGKAAGFVTTARVTHATPASLYAHAASREWETDKMMKKEREQLGVDTGICKDIARQLVEDFPGNRFKVILGGGRRNFEPSGRLDGRNLTEYWINKDPKRVYVSTKAGLKNIDLDRTDSLLGLFSPSHMDFEISKSKVSTQPSIVEMTETAIKILEKSKNGYFLLVEGAKIDLALHRNQAKKSFVETMWMDKAVEVGMEMTKEKDTLLLVTADHSHALNIGGYPHRNISILGHFEDRLDNILNPQYVFDNLTVPILSFANGESGLNLSESRQDLSTVDTEADEFRQPAFIGRNLETHGGEDVAVYARGPFSHLLSGTNENTHIPCKTSCSSVG